MWLTWIEQLVNCLHDFCIVLGVFFRVVLRAKVHRETSWVTWKDGICRATDLYVWWGPHLKRWCCLLCYLIVEGVSFGSAGWWWEHVTLLYTIWRGGGSKIHPRRETSGLRWFGLRGWYLIGLNLCHHNLRQVLGILSGVQSAIIDQFEGWEDHVLIENRMNLLCCDNLA